MPPAVVGLVWPAASPIVMVLPVTNSSIGPPTHTGANIFRITENCAPLLHRKEVIDRAALMFLPANPTLPLLSPIGITQAKKPGYFKLSNSTITVSFSIQGAYTSY